jgi:hypothetical protein
VGEIDQITLVGVRPSGISGIDVNFGLETGRTGALEAPPREAHAVAREQLLALMLLQDSRRAA